MKTLRWFAVLLILFMQLISMVTPWSTVKAQQVVEVKETKVDYYFGGQVTFWAKTNLEKTPESVQIFFKGLNQNDTIVGEVSVRGDELIYIHDLIKYPLPAFSEIQYWFGIKMPGEQAYISPKYSFFYDDNRFSWQTLEDKPFRVHWYEGDLAFGQMVMDTARNSLERANQLLSLNGPEKVDIYVYANGAEMLSTLNLGDITIVAGHADPELGVMFVSLPEGAFQQIETERQIPHELMHILLYQKLGADYADLPTWLNEGLASLNETYPNPDYVTVLEDAAKKGTILPMSSLCQGFTLEGGQYYLSYAQADSFTRYLYETYGADGIQTLIQAYASGLDCERGAEVGLGKTLTQLESQWQRHTFNQNPLFKAFGALLPWVVILLLMLLTPILLIINSLLRGKNGTQKLSEKPAAPGG
jgi:hypothetical protein